MSQHCGCWLDSVDQGWYTVGTCRHCLLVPKCIEHLSGQHDFTISSFRFRVSSILRQGREAPRCLQFTLGYFNGAYSYHANGQKQQKHITIIIGIGKNKNGRQQVCINTSMWLVRHEWSFGIHRPQYNIYNYGNIENTVYCIYYINLYIYYTQYDKTNAAWFTAYFAALTYAFMYPAAMYSYVISIYTVYLKESKESHKTKLYTGHMSVPTAPSTWILDPDNAKSPCTGCQQHFGVWTGEGEHASQSIHQRCQFGWKCSCDVCTFPFHAGHCRMRSTTSIVLLVMPCWCPHAGVK